VHASTRDHRRKLAVLGLGAVGLAAALTAAALAAPSRVAAAAPTYRPSAPHRAVAAVPRRSASDLAARRALAAAPDRVELAVELARADIARYRAGSDPRFLGRAQATLAPWWPLAEAPADVLLLRATIAQALHQFADARADLDRLIAVRPADTQAHLTRAVVATVTADYAAARASCRAVAALASPLVAATCEAPLDAIAGDADAAYARLTQLAPAARGAHPGVRTWALTALAELAIARGDADASTDHLRAALAIDASDGYALDLLADVLLAAGRPAEASRLLAGREQVDAHLLRRAIAEHAMGTPEAPRLAAAMRDRIAAAAERGDRVHLREEARFALAVERAPARAAALARANWAVQKELADARLLAEAALAARDPEAAAPVVAWARATGVRDVELAGRLAKLGGLP